jgi:hypothetical protein
MTVIALLSLLFGSFAGLVIGRWAAALPLAAAIPAVAVAWGAEAGAIAGLAAAGLLAGVHLHGVVSDASVPR